MPQQPGRAAGLQSCVSLALLSLCLFFFFFNVSRMIEIKYLRRSTKLNGMFGWSQGADRRESSLVMVVSQRNLLL